ncbi:MAG: DUF4340 domain-containing protein [Deltaproteobacteria bacterium]|nr:MAG: DUF4340 domain-containing protein [Deltaproteobacteria bacterium]
MKIRKEYIILVVVILALSLYLLLRREDRTHYQLPNLPRVARADISKIEISKKGIAITLNKRDNIWRIAPHGYPADAGKVKNMLNTIEKLTLTTLVSESKNYSRYDLDDGKRLTIRAWIGDTLKREFAIGKVAPSYRHTFVQVGGDHRVYHAGGNFRGILDQTADTIRDKMVLEFEKAEIQEIQVNKGGESVVFGRKQVPVEIRVDQDTEASSPPGSKTETLWESAEGQRADETKLDRLLTTLSNLRCEKYVDDRKKEEFTEPVYTVQLRGVQEYSLSIFDRLNKDAKAYPAISSVNDYPFLLQERQAQNIMIDPREMLAKPQEQGAEKEEKD